MSHTPQKLYDDHFCVGGAHLTQVAGSKTELPSGVQHKPGLLAELNNRLEIPPHLRHVEAGPARKLGLFDENGRVIKSPSADPALAHLGGKPAQSGHSAASSARTAMQHAAIGVAGIQRKENTRGVGRAFHARFEA